MWTIIIKSAHSLFHHHLVPSIDFPKSLMSTTEEFLFYPTKRVSATCSVYEPESFRRCIAQQPLEFLPRHLCPRFHTGLQQPKLWYGWRVGEDRLMEIVKKHFHHCIRRMPDVEYEHFTPTGKGNRFTVDVYYTLQSSRLLK